MIQTNLTMDEIRQIQKKYCSQAITTAIIVALICIVIGQKPIAKGLIIGALFSIVNFVLMGQAIPMKVGRTRKKNTVLSFFAIIFRYVLMAVPLIIGLKFDTVDFFAVVAGLFSIQILILVDNLIIAKFLTSKR
ncbi:ATP synthase subunit I [Candidatus Magnetomoraceae bacterium gMMP-1]